VTLANTRVTNVNTTSKHNIYHNNFHKTNENLVKSPNLMYINLLQQEKRYFLELKTIMPLRPILWQKLLLED